MENISPPNVTQQPKASNNRFCPKFNPVDVAEPACILLCLVQQSADATKQQIEWEQLAFDAVGDG